MKITYTTHDVWHPVNGISDGGEYESPLTEEETEQYREFYKQFCYWQHYIMDKLLEQDEFFDFKPLQTELF